MLPGDKEIQLVSKCNLQGKVESYADYQVLQGLLVMGLQGMGLRVMGLRVMGLRVMGREGISKIRSTLRFG